MGKRMRRQWDLPSGQVGALVALSTFFLVGGAAGCLFAGMAEGTGAEALCAYLSDYLFLAEEQIVLRNFWSLFWQELQYFLFALLLGVTALGVLGLPVLFFLRGFLLSFSVACFVCVFGGIGFLPAAILFGIPALLWTPALFLVGTTGLAWAQSAVRRPQDGRAVSDFGGAYWIRAGTGFFLLLFCALLEYLVVPDLLCGITRFLL